MPPRSRERARACRCGRARRPRCKTKTASSALDRLGEERRGRVGRAERPGSAWRLAGVPGARRPIRGSAAPEGRPPRWRPGAGRVAMPGPPPPPPGPRAGAAALGTPISFCPSRRRARRVSTMSSTKNATRRGPCRAIGIRRRHAPPRSPSAVSGRPARRPRGLRSLQHHARATTFRGVDAEVDDIVIIAR